MDVPDLLMMTMQCSNHAVSIEIKISEQGNAAGNSSSLWH